MSDKTIGAIEWHDLTVDDASTVRDFYKSVVGWQTSKASMGDYDDYNIQLPDSGETVAGVCHARGFNEKMPPQWMIYVRVASVEESAAETVRLGGKVIDGPKAMGSDDFCVIQDPAGAVLGLVSSRP